MRRGHIHQREQSPQDPFPLIERVNADRDAVEIVSREGNAVLMPTEEYAAWQETAYLFRSPANARRLLDAYERACAGAVEVHDLDRVDLEG